MPNFRFQSLEYRETDNVAPDTEGESLKDNVALDVGVGTCLVSSQLS